MVTALKLSAAWKISGLVRRFYPRITIFRVSRSSARPLHTVWNQASAREVAGWGIYLTPPVRTG